MRRFCSLLMLGLIAVFGRPAFSAPPAEPPDAIVCRGLSAVGFSYWWGGECWCSNGCAPDLVGCAPGVCTPNAGSTGCPDCTHTGTYGADCSGFVSRAWQVPDPLATNACNTARYVASDFTADHAYWSVVPMNDLRPADAVASDSHVILVIGAVDAYGENDCVEAKGCSYGIVRNSRTFSSVYSGARRISLTTCECDEGGLETESCGDCGTRSRSCTGCIWTGWSDCDGPDPTGVDASCTVGEGAVGVCAQGRSLCVAGWLTCSPNTPGTEVCDGEDNDCDGTVDNGTPVTLGEGYACVNRCGAGVSDCIDGAVRCVTPGTTWPDDTCNSDDPGDPGDTTAGDGCSCVAGEGGRGPRLPLLPAGLFMLVLLRRRWNRA